jgi:hypothetical protein
MAGPRVERGRAAEVQPRRQAVLTERIRSRWVRRYSRTEVTTCRAVMLRSMSVEKLAIKPGVGVGVSRGRGSTATVCFWHKIVRAESAAMLLGMTAARAQMIFTGSWLSTRLRDYWTVKDLVIVAVDESPAYTSI